MNPKAVKKQGIREIRGNIPQGRIWKGYRWFDGPSIASTSPRRGRRPRFQDSGLGYCISRPIKWQDIDDETLK
jgi:hypothetical protein